MPVTRRCPAGPASCQASGQAGRGSGVGVLVLTTFDIDRYVFAALRAGARGFLLKDATPEELLAAIRIVAAGEALLAPAATRHLVADFVSRPAVGRPDARLAGELTRPEPEVLAVIAQGLSPPEVDPPPAVRPPTAQHHRRRVPAQPGLRDRAQLVI